MTRCALLLFAVSTVSSVSPAQQPTFSGDWVRQDSSAGRTVAAAGDAAFRRGDMGIGWGPTLTINQRADSLIVEYDWFSAYDLQPRVRYAYAMNGAESRNGIMLSHSEEVQLGKLSWQGNSLVITTMHPLPKSAGGPDLHIQVRQTLTLEPNGVLVVETARGEALGNPASVSRAAYIRK